MEYTQELTVDIYGTAYQYINAKQYDNESRYIKISITADGVPVQLEGLEAHIRALKPDGHSVDNTAQISGNAVIAELTDQILACEGVTLADIVLLKDGKILSSVSFFLEVGKAPVGQNIESKDEFGAMVDATKKAREAASGANEAARQATETNEAVNTAEAARVKAEEARKTAEGERANAEAARDSAEKERASAEDERGETEQARQTAETARDDAERQREQDFADAIDASGTATAAANDAATAAGAAAGAASSAAGAANIAAGDANTAAEAANEAAQRVEDAVTAAGDATEAANTAAEAATGAAESATNAAKDAEAARQAIEDMTVEASSIPAGSKATVTKSTGPSGAVNLAFGIPAGETGPVGPAGPPGGVDSVDGMQGNIKTRLSFEVSLPAGSWSDGAQTVKDARFLTGDYDYIVDLAGQLSGADDVTVEGQMTFHADLIPTAAVTVKIVRLGVYIDG